MGITFPDNDKRKERVIELSTDTEDSLFQAMTDYNHFQRLCAKVNTKIATAYEAANLQPPKKTRLDIIKLASPAHSGGDSAIVEVADVVAVITGFVGHFKFFAPGASKLLVKMGAMTDAEAAEVLRTLTIPILSKTVDITRGELAGQLLGGIFSGAVLAGAFIAIDAIEGAQLKSKLDEAIDKLYPIRLTTKVSQEKATTLLDSLETIATTLDAISLGDPSKLSEKVLNDYITKSVEPAVNRANAITDVTEKSVLSKLDTGRDSWTDEDPR